MITLKDLWSILKDLLFKKPEVLKEYHSTDKTEETLKVQLAQEKRRTEQLKGLVKYYKSCECSEGSKGNKTSKGVLGSHKEYSRRLTEWAKRVKKAGKCDTCGSEDELTAHHLYDKKTHPSLRFVDDNGVCLCKDCHEKFHSMFNCKTNCTPKMYEKFKVKFNNSRILENVGGKL